MNRITTNQNKMNAVENIAHLRFGAEGDACTAHSDSTALTATGG